MTPEEILSRKPRVLTPKQRESYFENGYILLERIIPDDWIETLRSATEEMVDRSRKITKSAIASGRIDCDAKSQYLGWWSLGLDSLRNLGSSAEPITGTDNRF